MEQEGSIRCMFRLPDVWHSVVDQSSLKGQALPPSARLCTHGSLVTATPLDWVPGPCQARIGPGCVLPGVVPVVQSPCCFLG